LYGYAFVETHVDKGLVSDFFWLFYIVLCIKLVFKSPHIYIR